MATMTRPAGTTRQLHSSLSPLGDLGVVAAMSGMEYGGKDRASELRTLTGYASGQAGGYLIAQGLWDQIFDRARSVMGPLNLCRYLPCAGNPFTLAAVNETNRSSGRYGGVTAIWEGTSETLTLSDSNHASDGTIGAVNFSPRRCIVFSKPITDDLVNDAPLLASFLDTSASNDIRFALEDRMINGVGALDPQGVINSPATIVQAAESQSAGTINITNIHKMWSRLWGFSRRNAVWHVNDDTQLILDQVFENSTTPTSIYVPVGLYGNPFPLLKGRPVLPTEQCPVVGQPGDIILCDWSQYGLAVRRNPDGTPSAALDFGNIPPEVLSNIEKTSSPHPKFENDEWYFKFKFRCDGKLLWSGPITTQASTSTTSVGPCVILAAR